MSIPSLSSNIIQPQNIVINQVPLSHAIMPSVNANNGIPIATALAHAPTVEQGDEIKTSIVVGTIPIAGASIVGVQAVPVQNTSPVKAIQSQGNSSEYTDVRYKYFKLILSCKCKLFFLQVLPKTRLADLVRDTDPNLNLEDEVEELILTYVDEFVDRVIKGAWLIAKHRQVTTIEVKDVQQFLSKNLFTYVVYYHSYVFLYLIDRNYNIWSPGFGTDELKPYKRNLTTESHKQRLALIRKALKNN